MTDSPSFSVSESKNKWLATRMLELGITEEELEERFVRSSGKGGQHLNKTSSAVQIRHLPTGIEARCNSERSQSINRFLARRALLEKIAHSRGLSTEQDRERARIRKQKNRRSRRTSSQQQQTTPP
jgi:protein subunit release factor B